MRNQPLRSFRLVGLLSITAVSLGALLPCGLAATNSLVVMTYNLRYASKQKPNDWPTRRPLVAQVIREAAPDVLGTQEGVFGQLKELASDLQDYQWLGLGREGGSRGEFMAVFYRPSRLEPLEYDHFWLSDTPDVMGSTTWGNSNRRMVTWIKFRDRTNLREFYFFNTHFDHQIQVAREKSAVLVCERIEALKTSLPVILVGDFNATAGKNPAYDTLTRDGFLADTWLGTTNRLGEGLATFNDFTGVKTNGVRIDWILKRGALEPQRIEINPISFNGQFPSDHCPVIARFAWAK
jgi:endonuclease/exonuclease/phosphatase family metal-dependent hydrolase